MASPYDILIDITAKAEEVKAAGAALDQVIAKANASGGALGSGMAQGQAATQSAASSVSQLNQGLDETKSHASGLGEMFEQAFAFGIGNQLVEKALEVPTRIIEGLREAAAEGIKFNAFTESTSYGLAGVLKQMDGDELPTFNAALDQSKVLMGQIAEGANRLGVSIEGATDAYKTTAGAMFHAGVSDLQQQIDLTFALQSAMNALNVPDALRQRDIQDILLGRAHMTKAGRELGLSDEDLKNATDQGKLYEFLMEKLSGYAQAGEAASDTFERSSQRMRNELTLLEASTTQPLFDVLKDGAREFTALLSSADFQKGFGPLGQELADDTKLALAFASGLARMAPDLIHATEYVLALSVALGVGNLVTNAGAAAEALAPLASRVGAFLVAAGPAGAILAAATAGLLALRHESEAMEAQTRNLLSLFDTLDQRRKALIEQLGAADTPEKQAAAYKALNDQITALTIKEEALRREHTDSATQEADAIAADRGRLQARLNIFDQLAGAQAKSDALKGNSEKAQAAATAFSTAADEDWRNSLTKTAAAQEDAIALQNKLAEARKAFGSPNASVDSIVAQARELKAALAEQDGQKGAIVDTAEIEKEIDRLKQLQAQLQTTVQTDTLAAAQAKQRSTMTNPLMAGTKFADGSAGPNPTAQLGEDRNQLASVTQQLAAAEAQLATANRTNTTSTETMTKAQRESWAASQQNFQVANELLALKAKADDSKAAADAERLAASKRDEAAARKDAAAAAKVEADAEAARELAVQKIRDQLAAVKGDPSLTDEEKVPLEIALLKQEEAQLLANIAARNRYSAAQIGVPGTQGTVDQYGKKNESDEKSLGQAGQAINQNSPGAQLQQTYTQLINQTAISSKKIGTTLKDGIMTGINAVSQGLTNLIFKTGSWRDVFLSAGEQIVSSLLNQGIEFVAHYALIGAQMLAHFAMSEGLKKAETTSTIANNTAKAASSATAALLESITTYGVAALIGVAAFVAAMALTGGFAEGGLIAGQPSRKDNRLAHVATGEYIVRSDAVSHYGSEMFEALNSMQVPRAGYAFASGGLVGGSSAGASLLSGERSSVPNVSLSGSNVNVAVMRDQHALNRWAESKSGRSAIVRIVREEGVNIGIPA